MSIPATSIKKSTQPQGFVLLLVVAVMGSLLFLAGYFLEQSTSEIKIARSENAATKSYYLAEAAVNEGIYKLKNDSVWRNKFLAGTLSGDTITHTGVFDDLGSYTITATSVSDALADITATATYNIGNQQARRVIKARMAKAVDPAFSWDQAMYGGGWGGQQNGNITISNHICTLNGGTIHANQTFKVMQRGLVTVNNGQVQASNNIITNSGGQLVLNNSTRVEGAPVVSMPSVDFDSSSATSLKNRADQTYTSAQFSALPSGTILNGITFVVGSANWANKNLTVNGILAASGDINLSISGGQTVTVNENETTGSGLLAKNNMNIAFSHGNLQLQGLMYTTSVFSVALTGTSTFIIEGGLIGWHFTLSGDKTGTCTITYDGTLASQPLDPVYNLGESPIIDVNHWEEQY